ncbi:site-specific integrase [Stutzerimonas stutzeri]|uniref:site-specific integrase n=1 Tax=Stutzerimonas stutzeri TaxID=316 RepID=UPI001ED95120|nr:site-specific integrase [Stutzerimonas stutzeri]
MAQPWQDPRSGIFYIRRRVPKDVKHLLPELGEFYKRTLSTNSKQDAKARFAAEWTKSEELFALARLQSQGTYQPTAGDAVQLAARWAKRELEDSDLNASFNDWLICFDDGTVETIGSFFGSGKARDLLKRKDFSATRKGMLDKHIASELHRHNLPPPTPGSAFESHLQEAFLAKELELSEVAYKRYYDDHAAALAMPAETPLSSEVVRSPRAEDKLLQVFEAWARWTNDTDGDSRDVRKRIGEYQSTINRFIELFGDLPVKRIKRKTVEEFQGLLRRLPSKGDGIRSLSAPEQIAKADALDLPRLSTVTVKNRLMALSAILSYAVRMEYLDENPVTASGITQQLAKASHKATRTAARKSYTSTELVQIFSSSAFRGEWIPPRASFGKAWFWLPLLLCYSGARREEIAQMRASEVRKSEDGIWYLDLMSTPEEDGNDKRTMKTLGSHRAVALHPDLIELGFLDYVAALPQGGQLFPLLTPNPDGWYGHNFGKRWGEYLKKVADLQSPVRPSHGFRHAFKTMCREAGVPEEIHDAMTGHDNGSVSRKYGERHLLRVQLEHLARLPSIARLAGLLERPEGAIETYR